MESLNLARLSGGEAAQLLRMAGQRGRAPLVAYLASQMIAAVVMPGLAFVYIAFVLQPDLAMPIIAAMASAGALVGYMLPKIYVRNLIAKRHTSLRRSWPDALDLLLICVESGMSAEGAFRKVAEEIGAQSKELAEEMSLTTAELAYLSDRRQAYENLGTRTGLDSIKAAVIGLIQSEKYGTSLGQTLRVLAKESRDFRMSAAEKKAAALPPKLTVPMILFFPAGPFRGDRDTGGHPGSGGVVTRVCTHLCDDEIALAATGRGRARVSRAGRPAVVSGVAASGCG